MRAERGARASSAGAGANVAADDVLFDLARSPRGRSEKNQFAARAVGRCGFCAGAFGDGGGDAWVFGGKIGAAENYAGAIPGIRGAAGKFVHGRICERAGEAKSFEWSRSGGCKDAGVERRVFRVRPHGKRNAADESDPTYAR